MVNNSDPKSVAAKGDLKFPSLDDSPLWRDDFVPPVDSHPVKPTDETPPLVKIRNKYPRIATALGSDVTACAQRGTSADELISGERQRELMRIAATPFFDAYLKGDAGALRFLTETLPTFDGIRFQSTLASTASTD